ncbi:MAG TPA: helix-turn-helix domain-containing protein [Candidatus Binatia bacterium]|nr:helix-turn-helix domain-containing protein [Candidatus Binatia bacterium]
MKTTSADDLLTIDDIAAVLKVSPATVRAWRVRGKGPRVTKVGKHVRFRRADFDLWLAACAEPRPAPVRHRRPAA